MKQVPELSPKAGDVVLLAGTTKGLFVFHSDAGRQNWNVAPPHFAGCEVFAAAYDGRGGRKRLLAAVMNPFFGAMVAHSDDFGKTWSNPEEINVKFPEGSGLAVSKIWQIALAPESQPDRLYCGVDPAALFVSDDGGEKWALCEGLHAHPHRAQWQPGGGGLCLHTIVPNPSNPDELHIAISTGGVYRTRDGGKTWESRSKGIRADFAPDPYPEFGQCVHKIARNPHNPEVIYLQNHGGVYRSDDAGDTWTDIGKGIPSDFGFAWSRTPRRRKPSTSYRSTRWAAGAAMRSCACTARRTAAVPGKR